MLIEYLHSLMLRNLKFGHFSYGNYNLGYVLESQCPEGPRPSESESLG